MDDEYDLFARFYRELIISTGHLKNEQETLLKIISELDITCDTNILDAACGTGDALCFLYSKGYTRLSGLDFSKKMLDEARNILSDIPYHHTNWNSLNYKTELKNQFDLVLVISVSILHINSIKEFEKVLRSFWGILRQKGTLVIDNRMWENSENGLIEVGRETNRYNHICTSKIAGEKYVIGDICCYNNDKQIIEYEIKSSILTETVKVSYLRISTSSIIEILYKLGFSKVVAGRYSTWPYELIYAYK